MNKDRYHHRFLLIGALIEIFEGIIIVLTLTLYRPSMYARFIRWVMLYQSNYRINHRYEQSN